MHIVCMVDVDPELAGLGNSNVQRTAAGLIDPICRSHGIVIYCGCQRIKNVVSGNSRNQDPVGRVGSRVYENIGRTITNFFRKTNFFYRFFLPNPFNYNYLQYILVF